jgi:hypothetical protein
MRRLDRLLLHRLGGHGSRRRASCSSFAVAAELLAHLADQALVLLSHANGFAVGATPPAPHAGRTGTAFAM